ncbi:MAG TPA: hypothetical protein PKA98_09510 [Acidimicrobiales bacterium]|nr:hypothetical protein [Acidimicrobiales bacterium]
MTRLRHLRRLLPVLTLLLVAGAACSLPEEKSFEITRIETEAVLNPDGSMDVVERATYDFTGNFSVGSRSFETARYDYTIEGIQAF